MRAAGYRGPSVFSPPALKMIEQSSMGLTRRINILADKALLAAFSSGSHEIGPKEIQAAVGDCEFSEATYGGPAPRTRRALWVAAVFGIGVLAGSAWLWSASRSDSGNPATVVVTPPATPPTSTPTATPATPPTAPASPPPATAITAEPAVTAPPLAALPKVGRLTRERLDAGRAWMENSPDDRWFIQVLAADADRHGEIEALLRRLSSSDIQMSSIHVYYSELSGKARYGVTYGDYATWEEVSVAMRSLPKPLRVSKPYPRQVIRLR
jgi:hypothetical protein